MKNHSLFYVWDLFSYSKFTKLMYPLSLLRGKILYCREQKSRERMPKIWKLMTKIFLQAQDLFIQENKRDS